MKVLSCFRSDMIMNNFGPEISTLLKKLLVQNSDFGRSSDFFCNTNRVFSMYYVSYRGKCRAFSLNSKKNINLQNG